MFGQADHGKGRAEDFFKAPTLTGVKSLNGKVELNVGFLENRIRDLSSSLCHEELSIENICVELDQVAGILRALNRGRVERLSQCSS
ncbi:hypothetical protein V5O48_018068 [Marasmius crinis-equi]|uniref:Uncharacterized protein n=1 Tax=Marasmius crinis-equi TaxID=585013 RepID=A0ABR3EM76_9AGAR